MKRTQQNVLEAFEVTGGIAALVVAGFVIQWWLVRGMVLFCLGLILLCIVTIEQEVAEKGTSKNI